MVGEWEIWACAQQIIKQHGRDAAEHAAERVTTLTLAGDEAGAATWRAIADRIDQLSDFRSSRTRH